MNSVELARLRLKGLGLVTKPAETALSVVRTLCALQGQDYPGALWAIGLRVPGSTEKDIEKAIANREIVRSWPLRGTLHVCAAEDLRWMLDLTAVRTIAGTMQRQKNLELDERQFERSHTIMRQVLSGGNSLSRTSLLAALELAGVSVANQRGYHLLFRASLEGVICIGPEIDGEQAFVLLDDWIPPGTDRRMEREAAVAEITWRYFSSHGPATLKDLVGWTGLTMGELRGGLETVKGRLEKVTVDGLEYWMAPVEGTLETLADSVFLLPGFDEFMLGFKNRDAALDPAFATRICPGNNGMFIATVVCGGQVRGTWKKVFRKGLVRIVASPFDSFAAKQREAMEILAKRYGDYLGLRAELHIE